MKQNFRFLFLLSLLFWQACGTMGGATKEDFFDGMWKITLDNGINIDLSLQQPITWYGVDEEGIIEYRFHKLISQTPNSMTFQSTDNPDCTLILTHDNDKQSMNVKIKYEKETIIDETYYEPLHKANYLYVNGHTEIKGGIPPSNSLGYAELGDRFLYRNIFKYGCHGIYLPDGKPAWLEVGTANFDVSEPILSESFPREWTCGKEYKSNGQPIGQQYNMYIEKIGGNRIMVTYEMMAPVRLSDGQLLGMADMTKYLGVIKGNRIILNKESNDWTAEANDIEKFQNMDKPLEMVYIPGCCWIMFDGNKFLQSF